MPLLTFSVPAIPIAQPRPRAVAVNGKARVFGAKRSHPIHDFRATVRMACQAAYKGGPIAQHVPVTAKLLFVLPRPHLPKKAGQARLPHTKRPDYDNLTKGALDALSGILWFDDGQLWQIDTSKVIAAVGEQPHVEITVCWEVGEQPPLAGVAFEQLQLEAVRTA